MDTCEKCGAKGSEHKFTPFFSWQTSRTIHLCPSCDVSPDCICWSCFASCDPIEKEESEQTEQFGNVGTRHETSVVSRCCEVDVLEAQL